MGSGDGREAAEAVSYNGIEQPGEWPPRGLSRTSREPGPVPYLERPPAVIPIDVGRQLLVDEFLMPTARCSGSSTPRCCTRRARCWCRRRRWR